MFTFSQELTNTGHTMSAQYLLLISLNMGTGELAVSKWENKVTGVTYLKK